MPACDVRKQKIRAAGHIRNFVARWKYLSDMNDQQILQELEAVLESLGVHVRHETLEGFPGGMCRVNGRCCMFLDTSAQPAELALLCACAIRGKVDLESLYLKPELRRYLDEAATTGPSGGA